MPFSSTEQSLYDHAKAALPRFLFQKDGRADEWLGAFVKAFESARAQLALWRSYAEILQATGVWLSQHALDRGTQRQSDESDATLRERLRTYPDALTRPILLATADAILVAAGVSGTSAMVELRRDRGFFVTDAGTGRKVAYMSRGYRVGSSSPPLHFIVILPYGTTDDVTASVTQKLNELKAAGYEASVEVRGVP